VKSTTDLILQNTNGDKETIKEGMLEWLAPLKRYDDTSDMEDFERFDKIASVHSTRTGTIKPHQPVNSNVEYVENHETKGANPAPGAS
jgi:hypothetical protein